MTVCQLWARHGVAILKRFAIRPPKLTVNWPSKQKAQISWGWQSDADGLERENVDRWLIEVRSATISCDPVFCFSEKGGDLYSFMVEVIPFARQNVKTGVWVSVTAISPSGRSAAVEELIVPPLSILNGQRRIRDGCLTSKTQIILASGRAVPVAELVEGDSVLCGDGLLRTIERIKVTSGPAYKRLVILDGIGLTRGHPIFINGEWRRPDEIAEPRGTWLSENEGLYNFVLAVAPNEDDSTSPFARTIIAISPTTGLRLVCSTLGTDCGPRLAALHPEQHEVFCLAYRRNFFSSQDEQVQAF